MGIDAETDTTPDTADNDDSSSVWMPWLADAPLFIDEDQIRAIYDAVLRPAYREAEIQLSAQQAKSILNSATVKGTLGLGSIFPWLKAEVSGEVKNDESDQNTAGRTVKLVPTDSATRQLVEIGLHYAYTFPQRVWFCPPDVKWQHPSQKSLLGSPRLLAAMDFSPQTKFVPMAAELNDGKVVTFFNLLVDALKKDGGTLPVRYPDDPDASDFVEQRKAYWQWFEDHWVPTRAMVVVENAIGTGGRPRWIDYRVRTGAETIHLHVVGHGNFDTGVFAYNLIKRGWKHGVRVIGTVKSEPDINVLAIYEK